MNPDMGRWQMHELEKRMYQEEFRTYDEFNDGYISQETFNKAFSSHPKYQLGYHELQQVWSLAGYNRKGHLDQDEFSAAMHVIRKVSGGHPMPTKLPLDLIPLSHLSANWADRNPFRMLATKPIPAPVAVGIIPLSAKVAERVSDELWILIWGIYPCLHYARLLAFLDGFMI